MNAGDTGVDVSNFQGPNIDYATVAAAGYKFAYVLVSDGTTFLNPDALGQARGFQGVGMSTGAYQFFRPADSYDEQTIDFVKAYQSIGGWSLPIMIDSETEDPNGWPTLAKYMADFRSNLITATGDEVGYYVNDSFYANLAGFPWGASVWLADPSHPNAPTYPCLLQQTGTISVPGIGTCDIDVWRTSTAPPPPPPIPPSPEENETVAIEVINGVIHVTGVVNNVALHWWQVVGQELWGVEKLPHALVTASNLTLILHYVVGLAVIGTVAALGAVGTITGDQALGVIIGVGSLLLGVSAATLGATMSATAAARHAPPG